MQMPHLRNIMDKALFQPSLKYQILLFVCSGVLLAVVDMGLLFVLTEFAGFNYLISAPISFTVATILNYIVSRHLIFKPGIHTVIVEFHLFFIFAILGLLVNEGIMWLSTSVFGIYYIISKLISSLLIGIFNFISRRLLIFRKRTHTLNE